MTNDVKFLIQPENGEIVFRTGEAAPIIQPEKFSFAGSIEAPLKFYNSRISAKPDYFDKSKAVLQVDMEQNSITFFADPTDRKADVIVGQLFAESLLEPYKINTGSEWNPRELAAFLRMNRMYFSDASKGAALISELSSLKISIKGEIEQANDNRGNRKSLFSQVVETHLPVSFDLNMPIFSGGKKMAFTVDLYLDIKGASAYCSLESVQLIELTRDGICGIINDQLEGFKDSGFPILFK